MQVVLNRTFTSVGAVAGVQLIVGTAVMVPAKVTAVVNCGVEAVSAARTAKLKAPATVGVPETVTVPLPVPDGAPSVSPDGSEPALMLQVYELLPKDAVQVVKNGIPTSVGPAVGVQLMVGEARMVPENACGAVEVWLSAVPAELTAESATWTV